MSTKEEIAKLREQYKTVIGRNPAPKWDAVELQKRIDSFDPNATEIVEAEKPKEEKAKSKYEVFQGVELDPNRTFKFKLIGRANPRTMMPREALVWDEEKECTRSIRLCSIEKSPYLDEQKADSRIDSSTVIFHDGEVSIEGQKASVVKYMLAFDGYNKKKTVHPNNSYVKGMYELVDEIKISEVKLDHKDAVIDAQLIIRKASDKELANFLRSVYLESTDTMSANDIKIKAYENAVADPYIILKEFTDPKHEIKANVQRLFAKGLLNDDNNLIKWTDTNGVITTYDEKNERADDVLVKFVLIGEKSGKEFKERMEAKLKE